MLVIEIRRRAALCRSIPIIQQGNESEGIAHIDEACDRINRQRKRVAGNDSLGDIAMFQIKNEDGVVDGLTRFRISQHIFFAVGHGLKAQWDGNTGYLGRSETVHSEQGSPSAVLL